MTWLRDLWELAPATARGALVLILGAIFIFWVRTRAIGNAARVLEAQRALHQEHLIFNQEVIRELRAKLEDCESESHQACQRR
jgi:hypothetical protein